jgi:hypothetical protein
VTKGILLALLILPFVGCVCQAQGCDEGPAEIKSWLHMPPGSTEWVGIIEKQVDRAGDKVAIGIARVLTPQEMLEPQWLDRILPLIRHSFRNPQLIVSKEDREPRVTMVLLSYLRAETSDESVRKRVVETQAFILEQTRNHQGRLGP